MIQKPLLLGIFAAFFTLISFRMSAQAPSVQTNDASRVFSNSAVLSGYVDPNGDTTTGFFVYGTNFSSLTDTGKIFNLGLNKQSISQTISGLQANTTYWYRIIAKNKKGTSYGFVNSFYTPQPAAPYVYTYGGWAWDTSRMELGGNYEANGLVTTTWFEYGTTTTLTDSTAPVIQKESWASVWENIGGLKTFTKYYIRMVAKNDSGIAYGGIREEYTVGNTAPVTITDSASNISQSTAMLNGRVNSQANWYGCRFDYGTSPAALSKSTNSFGSQSVTLENVSYEIYGLTSNTIYYFQAVAWGPYGTSYGKVLSFKTQGSAAPTADALTADSVQYTAAVLRGYYDDKGTSPTEITFQFGKTIYLGSSTVPKTFSKGKDTVRMTIKNLLPGTIYYYRLKAQNSQGITYSSLESFTTPNNQAPTVTTDSVQAGLKSANVYGQYDSRGTTTKTWIEYDTIPLKFSLKTSAVSQSKSASNISETLLGLKPNRLYYFRLVAENKHGVVYGATKAAWTANDQAPTVKTDSASAIGDTYASLNAMLDGRGTQSSFIFEYGLSPNSLTSATKVLTGGKGSSTQIVVIYGLKPYIKYYYRIVGSNTYGTANGKVLSFTTMPNQPPIITTLSYSALTPTTVKIKAAVDGLGSPSKISFRYGTTLAFGSQTSFVALNKIVDTTEIAVQGLKPNTHYYYQAIGKNNFGTDTGSTYDFITPNNQPPYVRMDSVQISNSSTVIFHGYYSSRKTKTDVWIFYDTLISSLDQKTSTILNRLDSAAFTQKVTKLKANTWYYYQAFAQNQYGHDSSEIDSFLTPGNQPPVVKTLSVSFISSSYAIVNASANGRGTHTKVFFLYGKDSTNISLVSTGNSIGKFTAVTKDNLLGLNANTRYFYRAVAVNVYGSDTGDIVSFKTLSNQAPLVTTLSSIVSSPTQASIKASVDGQGTLSQISFRFGTTLSFGSQTPFVNMKKVADTSEIVLTGLTPNTHYFYQAIGKNMFGTDTGSVREFMTPNNQAPTIEMGPVEIIDPTTVRFNGYYNSKKTASAIWVSYGQDYLNQKTTVLTKLTDSASFTFKVTGLKPNTWYYYQGYAQNQYGTDSSSIDSFLTPGNKSPWVITLSATSVTRNYAILHSVANGQGTATTVYFLYGKDSANLQVTTSSTNIGRSFSGDVAETLIALSENTTYYYRAVAVNAWGTSYGAVLSFKTPATPIEPKPEYLKAITLYAGKVTESSAQLQGFYEATSGPVTVWFEYGVDSFEFMTSKKIDQAPSDIVLVQINGLLPTTKYLYRFVAQNSLGIIYSNTMSFTTEAKEVSSIAEQQARLEVKAYPNPCRNQFTIEAEESGTVSLFDLSGRTVKQIPISVGSTLISVSDVQPGTYVYSVQSKSRIATGKLIITK